MKNFRIIDLRIRGLLEKYIAWYIEKIQSKVFDCGDKKRRRYDKYKY